MDDSPKIPVLRMHQGLSDGQRLSASAGTPVELFSPSSKLAEPAPASGFFDLCKNRSHSRIQPVEIPGKVRCGPMAIVEQSRPTRPLSR